MCAVTNLIRTVTQLLDWLLGVLKVTGDAVINSKGAQPITDYLQQYDYDVIQYWLQSAAHCIETAGSEIYEPLGDLITALIYVISDLFNIIVQILVNAIEGNDLVLLLGRNSFFQTQASVNGLIRLRASDTMCDSRA